MENLQEGMKMGLSLDISRLSSDAQKAEDRMSQLTNQFIDSGASIDRAFNKAYGTILSVLGVSGVSSFVRKIAMVRGEFQQLEVAYTTLLGSQTKANSLMRESVELAAKTPFDLQGVARGAKQLLAYNFEAEKIPDLLRRLGDVSAGLSLPLERLVYLYGTTAVQGRVFARDMMQFQASGIPIAQELAKTYGTTVSHINEMVSKGKIGFPDIERAIMGMTSEGGKFNNLMEAQSKTITGLIANLGDAIDVMFNELGESSEGVIAKSISGVTDLVENYEEVLKVLGELIVGYGIYKTGIILNNAVLTQQISLTRLAALNQKSYNIAQTLSIAAKKGATRAMRNLNKAMMQNPVLLVVSGLAILTTALIHTVRKTRELTEEEKALKEEREQLIERNKSLQASVTAEGVQVDILFGKLRGLTQGTKEYDKAKSEIISKYGHYLKGLNSEISSLKNVEEAYKAVSKAALQSARDRAIAQATEDSAGRYAKKEVDALKDIKSSLETKFSDKGKVEELFQKLRTALAEGTDLPIEDKLLLGIGDLDLTASAEEASKKALSNFKYLSQNAGASMSQNSALQGVLSAVATIKKGREDMDSELKEVESLFGLATKKVEEDSAVTLSTLISNQREHLKTAKAELQDLLKQSNKTTKSPEDYAKQLNDKRKEIKDIENTIASLTNKTKEGGKAIADFNSLVDKSLEEYESMVSSSRKKAINRELQDTTKNFAEKRALQKELFEIELKERLKDIDRAEEEARKKFKEAGKKFDNKNYNKQREQAQSDFDSDLKAYDEDIIKSIIESVKSRDEKRIELEKAYLKQIAVLVEANDNNIYDEAITRLREALKVALATFDSENKDVGSTLSILFGTSVDNDAEKIREVAAEGQALVDFLSKGWDLSKAEDNELAEKFGLTRESYEKIKAAPAELKAIIDHIKQLNSSADNLEIGFKKLEVGWDKIKKSFESSENSQSNLIQGLEMVSSQLQSISSLANLAGSALNSLSSLTGNDMFSDVADSIGVITNIAGGAMQGAQAGAAFGPIGAAVGGALGFVSSALGMAAEAQARHKAALEEVEKTRLSVSRAYTLELIKQKDLLEEQQTVFGDNQLGLALTYVKQLKEATAAYSEELKGVAPKFSIWDKLTNPAKVKSQLDAYKKGIAGLAQLEVVTGHKKTGWFGWGKGKDVYSGILEVYPDLIDKEGKLNVERAKLILSTEKMTDKNKETLKSLVDLSEAEEQAANNLKEYFKSTFGHIGDGLIESVRIAIKEGKSGVKELESSITKAMENIGEQLVYSLYFAKAIQSLENDITALYKSGLSEEEVTNKTMALLSNFYASISTNVDKATEFLKIFDEEAKKLGFDLYSKKEEQDAASRGDITTITQDQASSIDGRLTGMHMSLVSVERFNEEQSIYLKQLNEGVVIISLDVSEIKDIGYKSLRLIEKIEINSRELPLIKDKLTEIEKNTKEL